MSFQYLGMPVGCAAMLFVLWVLYDPAAARPGCHARRSAGPEGDAMLAALLFAAFFALALAGVPLMFSLLATTVGAIAIGAPRAPAGPRSSCRIIGGVEPFILIAVPLFIFAGEILSSKGESAGGSSTSHTRAAGFPARWPRHRDDHFVPDVRRRVRLGHRRHGGDRVAGDPVDEAARLLPRFRRGAARRWRGRSPCPDAAVDPVPRLRVHLRGVDAAAVDVGTGAGPLHGVRADRWSASGTASGPAATTARRARRRRRSGPRRATRGRRW
jgi:hypothetical protein